MGYSASKAALGGLVLPMARDLGRFGIRVVTIAPGVFLTPFVGDFPKAVEDNLRRDTPLGRPGEPKEFAHFVTVCIENSYLNGVSLRIDGALKASHL